MDNIQTHGRSPRIDLLAAAAALAALVGHGCSVTPGTNAGFECGGCPRAPGSGEIAAPLNSGVSQSVPPARASAVFNQRWRDGKAELSGYKLTTMRYGAAREATSVLIYVTEPMDRRTWVKDDRVAAEHRVEVIKLNHTLKFRTGIYPYTVMTSVFSPLAGMGRERFAPAKISFSAQEWCGHVFHRIYPKGDRFHSFVQSYFSSEGDHAESVKTRQLALYEDALLIQLRELDGPFAGGSDWSGDLVPSLWWARKAHRPLRPMAATIRRSQAVRDGAPVTRFELKYDTTTRTYDVERAAPRRVLGWSSSDGEQASLLKTTRLAYWKLNRPGGEVFLKELGLTQ